ncbi:MAG: MBL fold metallo-hydrolase [Candidatus Thermofonsia Clade 1 bacterium]|uniref:MBL fold metallo-hydrolase n=1 Tax=Candidatus Thermofonsia Clade 1 bacterium TaxID=2364210 RepID=A0A2M8PHV5_9CHLR|nr:MAG: MBL fold metallo-hydrolase [Candidatus Thermofonsia Clade 1 bacterium]RMF49684.1 MAG: MBL fold metallo-hydrolase [Chloroflexota bacterium]
MLIKYFYDERLAQASYLIGCAATGEALVIDPARDLEQYLRAAAAHGLRIAHVTETHIHADFVSGARELAVLTGATLYLSDVGTPEWKYTYADAAHAVLVRDGDWWMVGKVKVEVLHTPGHTPEHISFMITDTAIANKPFGVFTGDFLFVGDIGRPDLLEEAAGMIGTKELGARQQFATVQRFKQLPDYLQIFPGHGAGSACGKALGAVPTTTLGYEKLFNPAFQFEDEAAFVAWLLEGQPEAPRYFAQMKYVNKHGPALRSQLPVPQRLSRAELDALLAQGTFVADFRSEQAFRKAHLPKTVSIPATSSTFSTYVGWFVDYAKPFYFVTERDADVPELLKALRAIGVDDVRGYVTAEALQAPTEHLPSIDIERLATQLDEVLLLDVRGATEYAEVHLSGALNIPVGHLPRRLAEVPRDKPIVTYCASGYRSQIAASWLRAQGYTQVMNLPIEKALWSARLPTERGAAQMEKAL